MNLALQTYTLVKSSTRLADIFITDKIVIVKALLKFSISNNKAIFSFGKKVS